MADHPIAAAARQTAFAHADLRLSSLTAAIDLWFERLEEPADVEAAAEQLDTAEVARAARYRFPIDRGRFVARRAFLRTVLARYIGIAPARISYQASGTGKPEVDPRFGLHFSASHSDGVALVAISGERQVGVDLERDRPIPDVLDLAPVVCSARELAHLRALPARVRDSAFLELWTRKEACAKAIGTGLTMSLPDLDVGAPGDATWANARPDDSIAVASVDAPFGFIAAVAVSGPPVDVRTFGAVGALA